MSIIYRGCKRKTTFLVDDMWFANVRYACKITNLLSSTSDSLPVQYLKRSAPMRSRWYSQSIGAMSLKVNKTQSYIQSETIMNIYEHLLDICENGLWVRVTFVLSETMYIDELNNVTINLSYSSLCFQPTKHIQQNSNAECFMIQYVLKAHKLISICTEKRLSDRFLRRNLS